MNAIVFAFSLLTVGSLILLTFNNFLSWFLTFWTWVFYAFFYTKILKYTGTQNIVIGGLAGSNASLAGWVSVTGSIDSLPLLLVLIVFVWTPPHFWALAIDRKEDYENAGVPMMPVVKGIPYTKTQILLLLIFITSCVLAAFCNWLFRSFLFGCVFIFRRNFDLPSYFFKV